MLRRNLHAIRSKRRFDCPAGTGVQQRPASVGVCVADLRARQREPAADHGDLRLAPIDDVRGTASGTSVMWGQYKVAIHYRAPQELREACRFDIACEQQSPAVRLDEQREAVGVVDAPLAGCSDAGAGGVKD